MAMDLFFHAIVDDVDNVPSETKSIYHIYSVRCIGMSLPLGSH